MNQKDLTKTFIMVSKGKNPFGPHGFYKKHLALKGLRVNLSDLRVNPMSSVGSANLLCGFVYLSTKDGAVIKSGITSVNIQHGNNTLVNIQHDNDTIYLFT